MGKKWIHHDATGEFELDLAPLLAVMVKLVPVLLVSSAFVQLMMVETELPQVVKDAVETQIAKDEVHVRLDVNPQEGFRVIVSSPSGEKEASVPLKDGAYDFSALHQKLVEVKTGNPEVFRLELVPAPGVQYGDMMKIMDEARKARDNRISFPVIDKVKNTTTQTPYMFPDVVFANTLEG